MKQVCKHVRLANRCFMSLKSSYARAHKTREQFASLELLWSNYVISLPSGPMATGSGSAMILHGMTELAKAT